MSLFSKRMQDQEMERSMGNLLRYGVLTAAAIVVIGAFVYLGQHGNEMPRYHAFSGEPVRLTELKPLLISAGHGRGRALIQLGLMVLIATPIARIIFSIAGYIAERDYLYIFIASVVLLVILFNLF